MFSGIQKKTIWIFFSSLFLCVLTATMYGLAVYLFLKKKDVVTALPIQAAEISQKVKSAQDAQHFLSATTNDRAALARFLFGEDDIVRFLGEIEDTAKTVQTTMTLTSVEAQTPGGLLVQAEVSGSWENVFQFIHLLEVYPAHIVVTKVSLNRNNLASEGITTPEWRGGITLLLKSYIAP